MIGIVSIDFLPAGEILPGGGIPDNLVIVLCALFCNDATIEFRL